MKHRLLVESSERTILLVLDEGEEAMGCLKRFAAEQDLAGARFSAIGAFSHATVGFFDRALRDYRRIAVPEQVEVLSILGDIALSPERKPVIHAHAVLGLHDGSTRGGHLLEAIVSPTLELMLVESPVHLRRRFAPEFGIALIDPGARA